MQHLNGFYSKILNNDRLRPTHISLYMSLFQFWTTNRFKNQFRIVREEVMKASKIKSVATYHKCITDLHALGYIIYKPSFNPYMGSLITIVELSGLQSQRKNTDSAIGRSFNSLQDKSFMDLNKAIQNITSVDFQPPHIFEVQMYFLEKAAPIEEAQKFYDHYENIGWNVSRKFPMKSWTAAARNWLKKVDRIELESRKI
ncbi:transcriptional regulator [Chryseobacterium manosquense]|uniref:Transcriptional regulator n=1 Tax=Chryseobacterium manosquense TaxID=2754694 RepID=A0A7H1DXG1_9FLAO|nr:transcriptional regulator [Chryseobacterium manosquense]QNS41669.1 transcriptional regulator [Chryseobacterium manosquense]